MPELSALIKYDRDYKRRNLLCIIETWLTESDNISLEGYSLIRLDRDGQKSSKTIRGGLCLSVTAGQHILRYMGPYCSTDYELLSLSFRPQI